MSPSPKKKTKTTGTHVWVSEGAQPLAASTISADAPSGPSYGASAGLSFKDTGALIRQLKRGLPMTAFDHLQGAMAIPAKTLASAANIAVRTLNRRRKEGRLQTDESERLFRIASLYDRAIEVLGDPERARAWFKEPKKALGMKTPLQSIQCRRMSKRWALDGPPRANPPCSSCPVRACRRNAISS